MYKTAIFDLDGTILDTLDDLADAVNFTLSAHGYPTRRLEEIRRFVGNGIRSLISLSLPSGEETPDFETILADFRVYYAANAQVKTAPYAGMRELLAHLREAGVRVAVVSNKFEAAVQSLCRDFFGDLVEVAVGDIPNRARKPAPDGVYAALAALGEEKENAVLIGDAETDVQTARAAGIPCISVLWGFRDRARLTEVGASCFAETVGELEKMLLGA